MPDFEPMPGCEPIILERVGVMTYCGKCMAQMKCVHRHLFACPICGMNYEKESSV